MDENHKILTGYSFTGYKKFDGKKRILKQEKSGGKCTNYVLNY